MSGVTTTTRMEPCNMRIKSFPKYTKLLVYWTDIISDSSWHSKDEIDKIQAVPIRTVGFFLQNKKKELKIGHSIADDSSCDYTVIPWCVVTKISELKEI